MKKFSRLDCSERWHEQKFSIAQAGHKKAQIFYRIPAEVVNLRCCAII